MIENDEGDDNDPKACIDLWQQALFKQLRVTVLVFEGMIERTSVSLPYHESVKVVANSFSSSIFILYLNAL